MHARTASATSISEGRDEANLEFRVSATRDMLGIFQPRPVNNCRVCGNAEPLLPGVVKGLDEETQQSSPSG